MLQFYLQQLVMMFSLVSDGSHRERIQLMECNLEEKKSKDKKPCRFCKKEFINLKLHQAKNEKCKKLIQENAG